MRSIADRYGGTVKADPVTKTINVSVPGIQGDICAREIEEQVVAMSNYIHTQVDALFGGEIIVEVTYN
jgi:hypothetical protein